MKRRSRKPRVETLLAPAETAHPIEVVEGEKDCNDASLTQADAGLVLPTPSAPVKRGRKPRAKQPKMVPVVKEEMVDPIENILEESGAGI